MGISARTSRIGASIAAFSLAFAGLTLTSGAAFADSNPSNPGNPATPTTVTADVLATPQIDGVVWNQTISGNTVFVGGQFGTARPSGAAAGVNTVSRPNLLSYNVTNGTLNTGFAPTLDAQVRAVVASADGQYLFVGGSFLTVNGVTRNRIVKLNATTGAIVTSFATSTNSVVYALALSGNTLYLGGAFSSVTTNTSTPAVARTQLAAVDATTGAVLPWNPAATGGGVTSLTVAPDGSKVVAGGSFTTVNGSSNPGYGLAALNPTTGAVVPWAVNSVIRDGGSMSGITSLTSDASGVYGTGYVFGTGGNLQGTFRSDWAGNLVWIADCHGDSYSAAITENAVYTASHAHYCGTFSDFQQANPNLTFQRATALSKSVTQTLSAQRWGGSYTNFAGRPGPSLLNWYPTLAPGTYTGKTQAAWSVAANSQYVVYGGEFPTVNGKAQQGLVRFAIPSVAINKEGPQRTGATFKPGVVSTSANRVKVTWVANTDRDNATLSYAVYRDGAATPIYSTTADSTPWTTPNLSFVDTGVSAGTHSYRVRATDPAGNTVLGDPASVTVSNSSASGYLGRVLADGASNFWRLDESSGTQVRDFAGSADQIAGTAVTRNTSGATADGDTASSFWGVQADDGTSKSFSTTQARTPGPNTFSVEAWFSTTSSAGGKIVGFGDQSAGFSNNYDRHLYVDTAGRLNFGIYAGGNQVVTSPAPVTNGAWHQAVGTFTAGVLRLYVDGQLVGTKTGVGTPQPIDGYWRIGGDSTWSGARWFTGSIDDVSIYPTGLTDAQVSAQYTAGKTGAGGTTPPPANVAPTASFTTSTSTLTAGVNAGASSDSDGSIASYAWTFGDGSTATGVTASHTYAAAGTYTVGLTVTDNSGARGTTTRSVTVTAGTTPPASGAIATDTFARTVSGGWGTAETGGAWTRVGGSATSLAVSGGAGSIALASPASQVGAYLAGVSQTSVDFTGQIAISTPASGGGTQVSIQGRKIGGADYRATVLFQSNGTASVSLVGAGTTLASAAVPGAVSAGTNLSFRLQVTGTNPTTVRAKIWASASAEPTPWTVSTTNSTAALQTAGSIGFLTYLSGAATGSQTVAVRSVKAVAP